MPLQIDYRFQHPVIGQRIAWHVDQCSAALQAAARPAWGHGSTAGVNKHKQKSSVVLPRWAHGPIYMVIGFIRPVPAPVNHCPIGDSTGSEVCSSYVCGSGARYRPLMACNLARCRWWWSRPVRPRIRASLLVFAVAGESSSGRAGGGGCVARCVLSSQSAPHRNDMHTASRSVLKGVVRCLGSTQHHLPLKAPWQSYRTP